MNGWEGEQKRRWLGMGMQGFLYMWSCIVKLNTN